MGEGPHRLISWVGSALLVSILAASLLDLGTAGAKSPDGSIGAEAARSARAAEPASRAAAELPGAARYSSGAAFRTLPIVFEANRGQVDQSVRFLSRGSGHTLFLTDSEAVLVLARAPAPSPGTSRLGVPDETDSSGPAVLRMKLVGAGRGPRMAGLEKLPGTVNYLIGDDPARWRQNIPTYARVRYAGVYPGVDLIYHGTHGRLEYDFVLAPGANPNAIALEVEGAQRLAVSEEGDLVLAVPGGELRMRKPYVYQDVDGRRQPIDARYVLQDGGRIGFRVAAYDARQALVIDPVLGYSSYLGGSGNDQAFAVATDGTGHAYLTGRTFSANFFPTLAAPPASAPYQAALRGDSDVFVAKINTKAAGTGSLVYSTFVGGSKNEVGNGIAVDGSGNAYVTGQTFSTANFPAKTLKSGNKGASDGFIFKLNAQGSALLYSVYIGGSGDDSGLAIAVDSTSKAAVTGFTTSSNFPTTSGAYDTTFGGDQDAFVARLNASGTALDYSTYLGGDGSDVGRGVAVDAGSIYVTGATTFSTTLSFPTTSGAYDTSHGGGHDAFVARLNPGGAGLVDLVYSTFLGGAADDVGNGIAVDAGSIFVTGVTSSDDFPTTAGAFQTDLGGGKDAFVAELNPGGAGSADLAYSTFLGGAADDAGNGIAARFGNAYVTGSTGSLDFPMTVGPDNGGGTDAFVAKLHPVGAGESDLVLSTLLGGSGFDAAYGIAVDALADAYVVGESASPDFPTVNAYSGPAAVADAFVARLSLATPPALTSPGNKDVDEGQLLTFTLSATDPDGQTITYSISSGQQAGMSLGPGTGVFTWTPTEAQGRGTFDVTLRATNSLGAFDEKSITITVNEVKAAPILTVPALQTVNEGTLLSFTAAASDSDVPPDTLTVSANNLPAGASFDPVTQIFSWRPTSAQGGTNPYLVDFTVSDGTFSETKRVSIAVVDTILDTDQDGVPDPPGFDLDGNGTISQGVRNALGQFEYDNCPNGYNPDQADICNSDPGASAASSISASGELLLTLSVTFQGGSEGTCVVPVDQFNSICTLKDAAGAVVPLGGVPEAPPINLTLFDIDTNPTGNLICIAPGTDQTFTTTFPLSDFYPNLPDGNYTLDCQYVNFAHNPNPEPDDPSVWKGIVQSPLQSIFVGELVFSGFFSPADHEPFNRGRTVPVKFVLRDSSGALFTTATPQLFLQKLDANENPTADPPIPATSTGSCCTGNIVPFNTTENQYHYNMRTQPLSVGPWQLQLKPGDGTTHTITIVIK